MQDEQLLFVWCENEMSWSRVNIRALPSDVWKERVKGLGDGPFMIGS